MMVLAAVMMVGVAAGVRAAEVDARIAQPHHRDHPWGFSPDFADRAAWEQRAAALRRQVLVSQGLWPMPPKTPLNPVIHGRIERDDYTIEKVYFASLPGHYVTGNLYRPKKPGKHPAILSPYGHWPDGRFIWQDEEKIQKDLASGAEKTPEGGRTPLQARCAMLAKMGCIVFHYDAVGYCDSKPIVHREGFTDAESILRLQSQMGLQTWNSIRAVDFVLGLDDVDTERIAATGGSGGATQCILLGAADERVKASFPVVMISMNMQGGCVCENAPLLRVGTNNVELACLFAPRPQGAAAAEDWTHDFETRGLPEMKRIYALFNAADRVEGRFLPYPHNYNVHSRELMYSFMNRRLNLGRPEPVQEQSFVPTTPKELSVWNDQHPLPADAADAAGVRKWMTETSDAQLAALAKQKPDEYVALVRDALKAMVVDELPPADQVEVVSETAPFTASGQWDAVISRKGLGERITCRAIFPKEWGGEVLVWAHPDGRRSLAADAIAPALERGVAVIAHDRFSPGDAWAGNDPRTLKPKPNPSYMGFVLCHNRSILAERVHDLLSVIALAKGWEKTRAISLAGFAGAGTEALLTRALAGDAVARAAVDLGKFDFHQVTDSADPMLLPGALKYNGISGVMTVCRDGETLLTGVPSSVQPVAHRPTVTLQSAAATPAALLTWVLGPTPP